MSHIVLVIPSRNDRVFLEKLVNSLFTVPSGGTFSMVIVDDHSTDDTPEWVVRNLKDYATYIRPETRSYFTRSVNHGLVYSLQEYTSEYFLVLNSDIQVTDYWVAGMLGTALRYNAGVVGATLHYPTGHVQHLGAYGRGGHTDINRMQTRFYTSHRCEWVTGAALMARRSVFERVGLFPVLRGEPVQYDASDREFCHNATRGGFDIWLSPTLFYHDTLTAEQVRRSSGQYADPGMLRLDR